MAKQSEIRTSIRKMIESGMTDPSIARGEPEKKKNETVDAAEATMEEDDFFVE